MDEDERSTRRLDVPPTRVGSRNRRAPLVVLALGVAAIAGAITVAEFGPGTPAPLATMAPPSAPAAGIASPGASSRLAPVGAVPPRLSPVDLAARIGDGSLEGRLVFVDGEIRATPVDCGRSPEPSGVECFTIHIPGLGVPLELAPSAVPWADPPPGSWLVTAARDGALVYLGALKPDDDTPDDASELTRRLLGGELPPLSGSLFQVTSWLVARPVPPFLAADEPLADGTLRSDRGSEVTIEEPVIDVDPLAVVTPGPFLLATPGDCLPSAAWATCLSDQRWVVVARYEPSRSVRVQVP